MTCLKICAPPSSHANQALRKQMAALKARYESELDHLRQEAESQLQRLLAEQQQQMRVSKEEGTERLSRAMTLDSWGVTSSFHPRFLHSRLFSLFFFFRHPRRRLKLTSTRPFSGFGMSWRKSSKWTSAGSKSSWSRCELI